MASLDDDGTFEAADSNQELDFYNGSEEIMYSRQTCICRMETKISPKFDEVPSCKGTVWSTPDGTPTVHGFIRYPKLQHKR
jgi:hypothetical protein